MPDAVPAVATNSSGENIGAREIWKILAQGWLLIASMTLGVTLLVTCLAFLIPKKYEATVLLMPVEDDSGANRLASLGSSGSSIGGLAALAGLGSPDAGEKAEAIATLQSEALTERYIQQNDLLKVLYRDDWDAAQGRWKNSDASAVPTLWKANNRFKNKIRSVQESVRTGLVSMTITWRDPVQAAHWANDLVRATNEYLRSKAIAEEDRNIAYLEDQAQHTTILGVQQAIYGLIESEIKKAMLAKGRAEYALKVIDPAIAPEKPAYPQPEVWIPAAFFGSLLLSMFIVVIRGPRTD
jgi:uncharacterized protein involved in exopolysaccharide biosynthesis